MPRVQLTVRRMMVALAIVAVVLVWLFRWAMPRREPFRMTLKPFDGHTLIQFVQPDRGLISPEFPVKLETEVTRVMDLRSDDTSIPGCTIEFSDTTLFPGRFKMRISGVLFDVMSPGIEVGGKKYSWLPITPDPN